ncbi:MAG: thioredoxin-dependent thiol peroxidase [Candidatus ainarchaeum sp.]|nr:thioredoxin-dependent thiol peroxidase [Candidatus ainarchaeum sp.]
MLKENSPAPDFCLKDADEKQVCLKDFTGKWIVAYFYPKDNTPGCTLEAIYFTKYKKEFESLNAGILGISRDSCKSHKNFSKKRKLGITLLSDEDKKVHELYGVWRPKKFMGKEFLGAIRSTFLLSPEGKIAGYWDNVQVPGHVEEVLETLKKLTQ